MPASNDERGPRHSSSSSSTSYRSRSRSRSHSHSSSSSSSSGSSSPRTRHPRPSAQTTDYSSSTYWSNRFVTERQFEWLAPSEAICPIVLHAVQAGRVRAGGSSHEDKVKVERDGMNEKLEKCNISQDGQGERPSTGLISGQRGEGKVTSKCDGKGRMQLLHFGCGTSSLGSTVQCYLDDAGEEVEVVDADYVADSIQTNDLADGEDGDRRGTTDAPSRTSHAVEEALNGDIDTKGTIEPDEAPIRHPNTTDYPKQRARTCARAPPINLDVLSLSQLAATAPPDGGWDVLLDKSTADAISCGPDVSLSSVFAEDTEAIDSKDTVVEPIVALCHLLARHTKLGGRWVCISYSSTRFDHLSSPPESNPMISTTATSTRAHASLYPDSSNGGEPSWRLISKRPVEGAFVDPDEDEHHVAVADGNGTEGKVVYTPQVDVWAYILERI